MPNWRFLVVRHFGGRHQRQQTCARIKHQVEEYGLSNVLPLVKYELNRRLEYYLGIAVDTSGSVSWCDAEEAARQILVEAGVGAASNRQISFLVDAEEVQALLRGSLECESFTVPISYEPGDAAQSPPDYQLLSELDVSDLRPVAQEAIETEQYSRLLHWCSAIGSGGLDRIRQGCQALGINSDWGGAWSVLRRLVLLGHLEFDGGAALRWSVIPPTLVTPAEDEGQRILVGQRTPAIVENLRHRFRLEECLQPEGPSRLVIHCGVNEIDYRPGRTVRDAGCTSRQLGELLPAVGEWVLQLPVWDERDFARFSTEEYDLHADQFRQTSAISGKFRAGLYRFTLQQSLRRVVTVAFFDESGGRWICGDYYGLRFVARVRSGLCRVIYREGCGQLVVPVTDRWPMPYERALVLASGVLPQRMQAASGPFVFVYDGIPSDLAARMCYLLGLEMEGE